MATTGKTIATHWFGGMTLPAPTIFGWNNAGGHSIFTTIDVAPLQHVNVTTWVDGPLVPGPWL
jgi:hypothetical protein